MKLHLSFDDGPSEWTPQILDLLAAHQAKATFFVVGTHIEGREEILERMVIDGHTIANHTWSHPRLTDPGLTHNRIWRELGQTNEAIYAVTGVDTRAWRAPYFAHDERVDSIAYQWALTHVGADIVPEDCFTNDALLIAERVLEAARNTERKVSVVSLHDGIPPDGGSGSCTQSRQPTVDAVRIILEGSP